MGLQSLPRPLKVLALSRENPALALPKAQTIRAVREDDIPDIGTACIVFSKDRPLQLDATLRSLKLSCGDLRLSTIRVLYTTSGPRFATQYRVLAIEHGDVEFVREARFKPDLVGLVQDSAHVIFVVDDTLFVGPLSLARTIQVIDEDPTCLGFSYRLGRNTTYCYSLDQPQRVPALEELDSDLLTFDWTDEEFDFGYPLEVSSSLYRTADVLPLLRELDYKNPNTLESALAQRAASFRDTHPRLACYGRSVAFSVPANLVQTAWKNRIDSNPALTAEALADAYARGQRLDVERYRGFVANACHQELDFVYTRSPDVPTVSVITRCYAQAQYLPDAVASVVAQSFDDWELIIVDDGSPDDTAQVAEHLIDRHPGHRIRLLRGPNRGLSGALNTGIEAALGRYILPLDADDMIGPSMLERTVAVLENEPTVAIVYTDVQQFGEGHKLIEIGSFNPHWLPEANQFGYCSLYRREVWDAVGGYNLNMTFGYEDWDFWVGCVERGYRARRTPGPLFLYRIRSVSMLANALRHDSELRRQLRLNHPDTYRPTRRASRWIRALPLRLASRIRRGLRTMARRVAASR